MTNFEKYKGEILKIKNGVALKNAKIISCDDTLCDYCDFYKKNTNDCDSEFIRWLYEDDGEQE